MMNMKEFGKYKKLELLCIVGLLICSLFIALDYCHFQSSENKVTNQLVAQNSLEENTENKPIIELELDKTDLVRKDEVTVTAKIPDGDYKLYALMATLLYDNNVFESIDISSFSLSDENLDISYNDTTHKFGIINKTGAIPHELFSVRLKVKENAHVGDTTISLINMSASDGQNKITFDSVSEEVLVTRDALAEEVLISDDLDETNTPTEPLISTFSTAPIIVVVAFTIIVLLIFILYLYKNKNQNKKMIGSLLGFTSVLIVVLVGLHIKNLNKVDVNDDGTDNYEDAQEIIEYLLEIEGIVPNEDSTSGLVAHNVNHKTNKPSNKNKPSNNYDVNNDGQVDINDVGDSTEHTTEEVHYKVKLKEINSEYYIKKGQVTLEFSATVSPLETIKEIKIDDVYYPVVKNDSNYMVTLDTPSNAGIHTFSVTAVKLSNSREVKTKLAMTREILKDIPYVDMFNVNDKDDTLNFRLEDKDDAFISGIVLVTDSKGTEVIREDVQKENHITYEFNPEETYSIQVLATYDLDSKPIIDQQNYYEDEEIFSHNLMVLKDYEFQIKDVTITDTIQKDEKPVLTFKSVNNKNFPVEYIVINDHEYDVTTTEVENEYITILDDIDTSSFGKFEINIDQVEIANLKVFEQGKDYQINPLTYYVLKYAPNIQNIELKDHHDNSEIAVSYQFQDNDQTLESLDAVLVDSTDQIVDIKENIKPGDSLTLSYKDNMDGRYKVKFLADCNLGTDKHFFVDKNIGEEEILTQTDVYIETATVKTLYPEKGQPQYTIKYKVHVSEALKSKYNELAGVTLNGVNYDGNKDNDYTSVISFTVPNESGIVNLRVDRVKLRKESYQGVSQAYFSVKPYIAQIDVLKDKPTIDNLAIIDENYQDERVTFQFDVIEDKGGFESGEIELNGDIKTIKAGANTITFEHVKKDELFTLAFRGTYDLDTNLLNTENLNTYQNEPIYSTHYGLFSEQKYQDIAIVDLKAHSKNNNHYFAKNENIILNFGVNGIDPDLKLSASKVVVNEKEYSIENIDNQYQITLPDYKSSGIKDIKITDVILNNGKKVSLSKPAEIRVEVLKSPVTMGDFTYEIKDDKILGKFNLKDVDNASIKVNIQVLDEDNNVLQEFPYKKEIEINKTDALERYYVKAYASYDLDENKQVGSDNYYDNVTILDEVISLAKNNIELKDITDIYLYRKKDGNTYNVEEVNVTDLENNKDDYFVSISMRNMPTVYAKIKKVLRENDKLVLILDYEYVTKEGVTEKQDLRVVFGTIKNDVAKNEAHPETFAEFIDKIRMNPNGSYTLSNDLDASGETSSEQAFITQEFTGTIDGHGYTIKNLTKPLFNSLNGATITNLKFSGVKLTGENVHGTLANTANNSTIRGIFIDDFGNANIPNESGTLIGKVTNNSMIENCKVTSFTLNFDWSQSVGGLLGVLENSTVKNSYVIGKISTNWNFVSGFIGKIKGNSTLVNNYSKVNYYNGSATVACGFACVEGQVTAQNNISLNTLSGSITSPFISGNVDSTDNYYLKNDKFTFNQSGVTEITSGNVTTELFKKAHYDETIWDLKNVSYELTPRFKAEKSSSVNANEVKDDYDESKETLYHNLSLLMPFYDSAKIVKSARNIPQNHLLNRQEISHIIPIDESGNVVSYLSSDHKDTIKKIKIVFKDKEKLEYAVRYDNTFDMIANYRIPELKIDYSYNHYIIDSNSQLIHNLTNYLKGLTYEEHLDKLTSVSDSRLLKDYYYSNTKPDIKEFVLKYVSNSNYINTRKDEAIDDYLEKELKKDLKLEKALYVYNYFKRFYDVDIEGMKLYDFIFFHLQGFNQELTPDKISTEFLRNDLNIQLTGTNCGTNNTYMRVLSPYTNLNSLADFLEYLVAVFSNTTPEKWYASQFKGYLTEVKIDGRDDILYTLWDHVKRVDKNTNVNWLNYILPIITLPQNAAYIISSPTQFIIGAERSYTSNPDDPVEQAKFRQRVDSYAARMKDYYTTAASILNEAVWFNDIHTIEIDKRFTYDTNGMTIFQNPYSTEEPFHKNFNEVVGQWAYNDHNAATANGAYVIWRLEGVMDGVLEDGSEYTFHTWSHETAHNIDARLFLKNNGRRFDAGGEDYADGNLTQAFGDGDIVMNLSRHFASNSPISTNLDPSRINTPDKIHDFYNKLFQAVYIMDYLEGRAFLNLTSEEQSKVAVQAFYPNNTEGTAEILKYKYTVYHEIPQSDYEKMNLNTINDIYDNKLVIFPGVIYSTYIDNRYGGENIYKVHWYQPHNDYGRPDSYSLKWFAYEMLGYKGYRYGYIEYYSNINSIKYGTYNNYKTDLMAIRTITEDPTMDIDRYKKERFKFVEDHLENIQYIQVDKIVNEFTEALRKDAQEVKQKQEESWQKYPGDSEEATKNRNQYVIDSKVKQFRNSSEVRRQVYYTLKNQTNDFVNSIYSNTKVQDVHLNR